MRARVFASSALALAFGVACSSSDPNRSFGQPSGPRAGSGSTGGAAGAGGAAGMGLADNPMNEPVAAIGGAGGVVGGMGGGAEECMPGVFCAPELDEDGCGTLELETDVEVIKQPGNVLVLFDQSQSMSEPWGGSTKLEASRMALVNAVMPMADMLKLGALFFPTVQACIGLPVQGGAVAALDSAPQINFLPGPDFLTAFSAHFAGMAPAGPVLPGPLGGGLGGGYLGTPVGESFDRAAVGLDQSAATLTGITAIMLFTDGAPTCFPDAAAQGIPTKPEVERAAEWLAKGIKTYVVGLPGAAGVQLLNDIAVAGGTGAYLTPDDPAVLEAKLNEIVLSTVKMGFDSCNLSLNPPAQVVDKLQIVVTDTMSGPAYIPRDLGGGSGWSISPDGSQVELLGRICEDAKSGRFSSVKFEYGCEEPPKIPPIVVE